MAADNLAHHSSLSTQHFAWREIAGAIVVLITRVITAPISPWENDEFLFAEAVKQFDPSNYHPHPPGYPLFVLLGKLFMIIVHDPWRALMIVSIVAAPVGFVALARAFRVWIDDADLAVAGALLYYFSASMLVHGTLALSDGVSIAFVALALAVSSRAALRLRSGQAPTARDLLPTERSAPTRGGSLAVARDDRSALLLGL